MTTQAQQLTVFDTQPHKLLVCDEVLEGLLLKGAKLQQLQLNDKTICLDRKAEA